MAIGTRFVPVLAPPIIEEKRPRRINLVSGKIYYELAKEIETRGLSGEIELIRIEELCPFPFKELERVLEARTKRTNGEGLDICWVQEEHRNQGAWTHVGPRIQAVLDKMEGGLRVRYVGRRESAVPAVGVGKWHAAEHAEMIEAALGK
jgi:probable 2-oxoglutarate dehydrogenase E1 component DHKTD1